MKRKRAQELTAASRDARLVHAKQLLPRFSEADVGFVFFTDEKHLRLWHRQNDPQNAVSKKQVAAEQEPLSPSH